MLKQWLPILLRAGKKSSLSQKEKNLFLSIFNQHASSFCNVINSKEHNTRAFSTTFQNHLRVSSPKPPSEESAESLREKAERIKRMKAEERKNNPQPPPQEEETSEETNTSEESKQSTEEKTSDKSEKTKADEKKKKTADYEDMGDNQAKEKVRTKPNWHHYGMKYTLPIVTVIALYNLFSAFAEKGFSLKNMQERFEELIAPLKKPQQSKLLPDIPQGQPMKPVLVVPVENFLVYSSYNSRAGWKTQKRPGVDQFLQALSKHYEIVFFSDNYMTPSLAQMLEKIDQYQVAHKLFKDATVTEGTRNVKDLSLLNRPLERIIMIEHRPDAYSKQPENTLRITPWKGDTQDRTLVDLIPFLEMVATKSGRIDVRTILQEYGNKEKLAPEIARDFINMLEKRRKERSPQTASTQPTTDEKPPAQSGGWFGLRK
ncbi:hypothetical protein C9374_004036 [Naegleria lovaniensis]|uniref:Mitochondrial import inner membrane translocase subunit TIM50 n=1 Tax=Naegleria lovaniensis TaxID=51637 RepID=A0AA88H992_NAELO|nr:uncharacterized protein C9374_004036 [Naegleria lovaniensis]KAG2394272.1 hypothetical protein C9374_004036 [Naegleria lovaniensis]